MANCLRAARTHGLPVVVCDRPNPIGGVAVEGPMLEPGVRVVRRAVSDSDAARHDDRRAGAALQRALRHRRQARGRRDARLDARGRTSTTPACRGCCRRPTCRRSTARSSIRARCCSKARTSPRAAARRGRSSSSARRGSMPSRLRAALNALGLPGVHFRPRFFEPTFHKHAEDAVRRLPDSRHRSRVVPGRGDRRRRSSTRSGAPIRPGSRGASRRTSTSTRSCRSTSSPATRPCGSSSTRRDRSRRSRTRGAVPSRRSRHCATGSCSTDASPMRALS